MPDIDSPRPGKIAFTSDRDGDAEIYSIREDGAGLVRLTNAPGVNADPDWSPDGGSRILFTTDRDFNPQLSLMAIVPPDTKVASGSLRHGGNEIYSINADGTNELRLTTVNPADDLDPDWSPDATRIIFSSDRDDDPNALSDSPDIFVMNADGSNVVKLTEKEKVFGDFEPSWSADGARIAFTSNRDGNLEIYVMSSDGSGVVRLTDDPAIDFEPSWSPDGERIAFTSFRDGNFEIYLMEPDGSNVVRLTENAGVDMEASWSPDGERIAFASNRNDNLDIYLMGRNGFDVTRLTTHSGADRHPSWVGP
jgi:Tol biopolymer transport system component